LNITDFYTVINKFHAQRIQSLGIANTIDSYHDSADIVTQYFFSLNTPRNYSISGLTDLTIVFAYYDFFNDLNDTAQNNLYVAIQNLSFPTASLSYQRLEYLLNYNHSIPQIDPNPDGLNISVFNEVPFGSMNGSNTVFVLSHSPFENNFMVFLNGILMNVGPTNDFTISGAVIDFIFPPLTDDILLVNYSY